MVFEDFLRGWVEEMLKDEDMSIGRSREPDMLVNVMGYYRGMSR